MTKSQTVRTSILLLVALLPLALIVWRILDFGWLGQSWQIKAQNNIFYNQDVTPLRGMILDRYGQPLAWNQRRYKIVEDQSRIYTNTISVSRQEALDTLASESGQKVQLLYDRLYRAPQALAHIVGYVGWPTDQDISADISPQTLVGKTGLEHQFDQQLRGSMATNSQKIDAWGKKVSPQNHQQQTVGQSLSTTLDPFLSEIAYRALGSQIGSVVILDADTAQVLSIVNTPSIDTNVLGSVLDTSLQLERAQQVATWNSDSSQPFFDRAVLGLYPPGSVFKLITSIAALETGAVDQATTVEDEGVLQVGEYQYRNWFFTQYGRVEGTIDLVRALARSNDIYYYKAAEWTGPSKIAEFGHLFGLGESTELRWGEPAGLVPDPTWKEQTIGERWYLGNTYHLGIGQGDLLTTPLQVARMTQAFGNRGTLCQPQIVAPERQDCQELGVQTKNIDLVLEGMLQACNPGGTAFPFFERNQVRYEPGRSVAQNIAAGAVACKTGTAEFGPRDQQGFRATHGWFTAIVEPDLAIGGPEIDLPNFQVEPMDSYQSLQEMRQAWLQRINPETWPKRLVITVFVESDQDTKFKEGSSDAAPVAKEIIDWIEGTL